MLNYILQNSTVLAEKIGEHFLISILALSIGAAIAVPAGILLTRYKRLSQVVLSFCSVLQTVPSLALLAIMVPLFGVGKLPAAIALIIYSLLPILRNTYLGMNSVDKNVIDASKGMGMTSREIIARVQVPLAFPVIMSGIRLSSVYMVAWATLASYIGGGGLGDFIFMGLNNFNFYAIVAGTVPVTLMALLFDGALSMLEHRFTPKTSSAVGKQTGKERANA
jgi:osmoprotectant transport system permease protein